jgi:death-on-curing protein
MIHDVLVSIVWPGSDPTGADEYRNGALVSSAVARPFQTAFQEEIYRDRFEKAAALFHSLIANHPFHNGNKRTAVIALEHFLIANGYFLLLDNKSIYHLAKETATYRERGLSHEEILEHIRQTIKSDVVSLRKLKRMVSAELYDKLLEAGRSIRKHELNQQQPGGLL